MPGTRVVILDEIRSWATVKESATPVYCIGDVAGTGKSTVTRTLLNEWEKKEPYPFAFFFSQAGSSMQTASDFCFFIRGQIQAYGGPELDEYWRKLTPMLDILRSQRIEQQWAKLVYEPLCLLPKSDLRVLVVDALDECTLDTRRPLLECILKAASSGSLPHIRIFITTRNEPDILNLLRDGAYSKSIIHKPLRTLASDKADVALYVNDRLDRANIFTSSPDQRRRLIDRCDGLFIFAFLACKLLEDTGGEEKPLEDLLREFTSLDVLYHRTLSRADTVKQYTREVLKSILGVIVVAKQPLSISAIADLLQPPVKATTVETTIEKLGSILGSGGVDEPVYILHATFTEFLLRQSWVTTTGEKTVNEYAISKAISNRNMAIGCLSIMLRELKGTFRFIIYAEG